MNRRAYVPAKTERSLLCTFWLGELFFGVDVRNVQEILRGAAVTPVPHAPDSVAGLINLRGQIATTLDLRVRLGVRTTDDAPSTHVVVRNRGEQVSLLVDRVGEVIDVGPDQYEAPPVTMRDDLTDLIVGTYKLPEELLLVVDVPRLVDLAGEPEGDAA